MMHLPNPFNCTIAVIGLGYVGLPLAIEFASCTRCVSSNKLVKRSVIGYDINVDRIQELQQGYDRTFEVDLNKLVVATNISFTSDISRLTVADIFIVTVPTPVLLNKEPDLSMIQAASELVGNTLRTRSLSNSNPSIPLVVFESTVYPGLTEEVCVPIIESSSGLILENDNPALSFCIGYSPERINPGDKSRSLTDIVKITSGSSPATSTVVDQLYTSIIKAGTYKAESIKVAEAAKVIENTQRDLNIALINELSIICRHLRIDTLDVLNAASSKWNFIKFLPGLVGGHCIGVDPYYLTSKSLAVGYTPNVVLAGRRINDGMANWIASELYAELLQLYKNTNGLKVLVLGLTFKENCPDIRNTQVIHLVTSLKSHGFDVHVVDPLASKDDVHQHFGLRISSHIDFSRHYDAVVLAVAHDEFIHLSNSQWQSLVSGGAFLFDLKGIVPRQYSSRRL